MFGYIIVEPETKSETVYDINEQIYSINTSLIIYVIQRSPH